MSSFIRGGAAYICINNYDNTMNTTSQEAARGSGMRVVELLVTKMVVSAALPPPFQPRCARVAAACVPGHFFDAGDCVACPPGKFSATYAASGCTACPMAWDTQGLAGQSLCWPSSSGSRGPCPRHHCVQPRTGQCLPCGCPIDTYTDTSPYATAPCVRCSAAGQYTDDLGDCRSCAAGSIFSFNAGCRRCPKYSIGRECVSQCPPNSYRDTPLSCSPCPSNSTLDAGGVCTAAAC
jgi:hypothetical protein